MHCAESYCVIMLLSGCVSVTVSVLMYSEESYCFRVLLNFLCYRVTVIALCRITVL